MPIMASKKRSKTEHAKLRDLARLIAFKKRSGEDVEPLLLQKEEDQERRKEKEVQMRKVSTKRRFIEGVKAKKGIKKCRQNLIRFSNEPESPERDAKCQEEQQKLTQLTEDLVYIKNFPKSKTYIPLYTKPDSDEAKPKKKGTVKASEKAQTKGPAGSKKRRKPDDSEVVESKVSSEAESEDEDEVDSSEDEDEADSGEDEDEADSGEDEKEADLSETDGNKNTKQHTQDNKISIEREELRKKLLEKAAKARRNELAAAVSSAGPDISTDPFFAPAETSDLRSLKPRWPGRKRKKDNY
eukprot:GHVO01040106.1.p3 GENE.GHVO01040106.1~~GHVO01040106.1.p3  ORF type:complete len:298 (+),score=53.25 GHVO01040106.1:5029-5922(+)